MQSTQDRTAAGGSAYNWFNGLAFRTITALSNGIGAVVTFFVLSGFVLARSLDGNSDPVRFFRNSVFRLFPAAMAVVALLTALHWQFGLYTGYEASFDPLDVILKPHHRSPAHLRGVDIFRLASLPAIGDIRTPPDGGGTDLRPTLRSFLDGGDRRRGRSRCSG
jgi:hypothetical protein